MSLNKVMLIGNVGKDPEVRYLDGNGAAGAGAKVATFPLATSERYKDRNGELRENTEWHNIVAWRQSADIAEKYVHKGTQLYIEGRLRTRSYVGQDGVKKYTTEITVDTLQLLGRRENAEDAQGGFAPRSSASGFGQQGGYSNAPAGFAPQSGPGAPAGFAPQQPAAPAQSPSTDLPGSDTDDLPF